MGIGMERIGMMRMGMRGDAEVDWVSGARGLFA